MRARAFGLFAFLALASPGQVHAQSPAQITLAKQWFAEASSLEDREQWGEALILFRRASLVKMTPQVAFHIGLCEGRSGAFVEALVSLAHASELARAANLPVVDSAAKAESALIESRMPTLEISVKTGDKLRALTIDGHSVPFGSASAPLPLNAGSHEVVAEFPTGTVKKSVTLRLKEAAHLPLEAPGAASNAPKIMLAVGGAAVVGGFVFYALSRGKVSYLDTNCTGQRTCDSTRADLHDAVDSGKTYSALSATFFTVGVITLAAGGGLLLFGGKKTDAP
ncbi:MAG: hypothetical protein ABIP39_09010, partial [Polyangiaceae bacterium]